MKTKERLALEIACGWLENAGACRHYPGFICDKEFSKSGVCAACLTKYFLAIASTCMKKGKQEAT